MEPFTPIILNLGLLLLCGLSLSLVWSRFNLPIPRVVAYVLAGMMFSPDFLGRFMGIGIGNWDKPLTTGALGVIAYLIGGSLTIKQVKRIGKTIVGTTLGQSLGAIIIVFFAILMFVPDIPGISSFQLSLALAVIASTTAPAGTIAVLHQYRISGSFAKTLLGVVALDDALGIIFFSLMVVVTAGQSLTMNLGLAIIEIFGALVLGAIAGKLLTLLSKHFKESGLRLPIILGMILLVLGVSEICHLSPLLSTMSLGFFSRYFIGEGGDRVFAPADYIEELVFVVFFTVAGAHFEFRVFLEHFDLILIYFFSRIVGKLIGSFFGAKFSKAPEAIVRWLGFGLIPQAGVAIGLALTLSQLPVFQETSSVIVNVVLATTLFSEMLGSLALRFSLNRAGELGMKRKESGI
jgi:Kef-type K+ transport system membrane component KefB